MCDQIVLVTGGNGFLGQHVVRELQIHDSTVKEIRVLDRIHFSKKLDYSSSKPVKSFLADLRRPNACRAAFEGVDCVFHCAAAVSYEYPSDENALRQHNVLATENVIQLCKEENIRNLIFTSTIETVLRPYMKSTVAIMVYKTESRSTPPETTDRFLIPGYPESKLQAEKLILEANGKSVRNGCSLNTVVLRLTLLYGEEDQNFFLSACRLAKYFDNKLMRIFGSENMQQVTYAGNAAWAHITAKKTLMEKPEKIAGLPIFITDDTSMEDNLTFIGKLTDNNIETTKWWIPAIFTYLIALFIDLVIQHVLYPLFKVKLPVSLRSLVSYCSSVILFNRLRASIYLDYSPIYNEEVSFAKSREYYKNQLKFNCNKLKNG